MALSKDLIALLCCPENHEALSLAPKAVVESLNNKITHQKLINRGGKKITDCIDGALLRADGQIAYLIRDDIPDVIPDSGVAMDQVGPVKRVD